MKYPIGIQTFDTIINGGYVYVDKTDLIYKFGKRRKCILSGTPTSIRKEPSCIHT